MNDLGNTISNSIIINTKGKYLQKNYPNSLSNITSAYCDFYNNSFSMPVGTGNISEDPLFVDPANRDYHLKSTEGSWDVKTLSWVKDDIMSPCIDMGNPKDNFRKEPRPNGNRIDIGQYGNTNEASKSKQMAEVFLVYPNPFREFSTIEYYSPYAYHVVITVYDMQGRQISILFDEDVPDGSVNVQWDGTNSLGQKVGSGEYLIMLKTYFGYTSTQKVLYVRTN
jgi:hypothetical protein